MANPKDANAVAPRGFNYPFRAFSFLHIQNIPKQVLLTFYHYRLKEMSMTNKMIALLLLLSLPIWSGCAGVGKGRPVRPSYQDIIAKTLTDKYSKPEAIPADQTKITEKERNQILVDLIH